MSSHFTFNMKVFQFHVAGLFDAGVRCGKKKTDRFTQHGANQQKYLTVSNQKSVFHPLTLDVRQTHDRGDFLKAKGIPSTHVNS